jgi:hypothetical protein
MDELNKLSPAGWKILNASRLNPDADLDYQEILELEVLARCGGQTDRELDVILRKIGAVYDDPSAAVKAIRSGEISFEQIGDHWFVLVPGGMPTQRAIEIKETLASLVKKGVIYDTGEKRWSTMSGSFQPVYKPVKT